MSKLKDELTDVVIDMSDKIGYKQIPIEKYINKER